MSLSGNGGEERRTSPSPDPEAYRWRRYSTVKQEEISGKAPVGAEACVFLRGYALHPCSLTMVEWPKKATA